MKKISVISGIVLAALIMFAIISANPGSAANQPNTLQINVHVVGCDDCKNIQYCIDGGSVTTVHTSTFIAYYEDDGTPTHTICVHCCGNRAGTYTFNTGDQEAKVVVSQIGADCVCGDKKKK